jgi:hypothetical protein
VYIAEQQWMDALTTMMLARSQNLEPCRLIILKSLATQHEAFERTYWRSVIDFIEIFNDPNACVNHVKTISGESVFLIVEAELYEQIIARTPELRVIYKIYIFNARNDASERATAEK